MNVRLPTAEELGKLSTRAVVAYAARTARRVSTEFHGIVPDDILNYALHLFDTVSTAPFLGEIDPTSVIRASERVVDAYASAPTTLQSAEKDGLLFSLVNAALASMYILLAGANPPNARHQMKCAAEAAQRAARPLESFNGSAARSMIEAARRDYDILLREYGTHEDFVMGERVDCFEKEKGEKEKGTA